MFEGLWGNLVASIVGGLIVLAITSVVVRIMAGGWRILFRFAELGEAGLERLKQLNDEDAKKLSECDIEDIRRSVALRNTEVCPFPKGTGERVNKKFYDVFRKRIHAAQRLVIIVGQGIVADSQEEIAAMRSMVKEQINLMVGKPSNQKFEIIRIQTDRRVSPEWAKCLEDLLDEGQGRFKLFFGPPQITFSAVIDPKLPETSCAEMMMPLGATDVDEVTGDIKEMAGFGVFRFNDVEQADFLALKIRRLLREHMSTNSFINLVQARMSRAENLSEEDRKHDNRALQSVVVSVENTSQLRKFLKANEDLK